jgi:SAM-dependent methyltransferase
MANQTQVLPGTIPDHHFDELNRLEAGYWWYVGRVEWAKRFIARSFGGGKIAAYADVGCGTGGFARQIARAFSIPRMALVDSNPMVQKFSEVQGADFVPTDISRDFSLPFQPQLISLMDVLEHMEDDQGLLHRLADHLPAGGRLLISVPAHAFLFSEWDRQLRHYRRYSKKALVTRVKKTGLEVEAVRFMWSFLMPAAPYRLLLPARQKALEFPPVSPGMNRLLIALSRLEYALSRFVSAPVGTSLILIARKPKK